MNPMRRLLDKLSLYLPMIVLALLALGSWWLVRSVPALLPPATPKSLRQDPDYRLMAFSVKSFDADGRMTRELAGETAQHFPATQSLHIEQVRIYAQNERGAKLNAQAAQGIATDDGAQLTLIGHAQAIQHAHDTRPQLTLTGERMVALPDEHRIVSSDPVLITRDRDVFTAETLNFNSQTGEYELKGRVRGTLMPKAAR